MFNKKKDNNVRNLRAVPNPSEEAPQEEAVEAKAEETPAMVSPEVGADGIQLDELSELCRVAWCETFYRLAEGFSFKDEFVEGHLAPFMQQAGIDPEKLDADEKAKALITFSSYIVCQSLSKPLESCGLKKDEPILYSQAIYQAGTQAAQQSFVTIVDEWSFRTPMLPFVNVFAQAVFKQELDDLAPAYLFGPAYEITLRRALYFNKWVILPESEDENPAGSETEEDDQE